MVLTDRQRRAMFANRKQLDPENRLNREQLRAIEGNTFRKMDRRIDPKHRLTAEQLQAIERAKAFSTKRDIETGFIVDPSISSHTGKNIKTNKKIHFAPHGVAVHGWNTICLSCNKKGKLSPPQKSEQERLKQVREFVRDVEIPNIQRQRDEGRMSEKEFKKRLENIKWNAGLVKVPGLPDVDTYAKKEGLEFN